MTANVFFDTNIAVYAYDDTEPVKQSIARQLLKDAASRQVGVISVQVLGEFFHATVVRRKLLTCDLAVVALRALGSLKVVGIDAALVDDAIAFHRRFQLRYWDALILATARRAGARTVISEDLSDGQDYDGVGVHNPFLVKAN